MTQDLTTLAGIMAAAEELNTTAKKAGLEFWLEIDMHFMCFGMRITSGVGPGCQYIWKGPIMGKLSTENIAANMNEAAQALAEYQDDQAAMLEMEVANLQEKLKTKRAALREAKKGVTK